MTKETITNLVLVVVIFLWAAALVVGMKDHSYSMPPTLQLTMAAAVAYLFGKNVLDRAGKEAHLQEEEREKQKREEAEKEGKRRVELKKRVQSLEEVPEEYRHLYHMEGAVFVLKVTRRIETRSTETP